MSAGTRIPSSGARDGGETRSLSPEEFRNVIGSFASGVTVISTVGADGEPLGTTASAVSSLSLEPPMLLICMNKQSSTGNAIAGAGRFAVNILGEDQPDLAARFATKRPDKFDGVAHTRAAGGVPLLDEALATLECRIADAVEAGTHVVFIAEVESALGRPGQPLAYFRGKFGYFELAKFERPASVEAALDWMPALFAMLLGSMGLTIGSVRDEQVAELRRLREAIDEHGDPAAFVHACVAFFERFVELTGSEALLAAFRRAELSEMVAGTWSANGGPGEQDRERIVTFMSELLGGYEQRDPAATTRAAQAFMEFTLELLRRTFRTASGR